MNGAVASGNDIRYLHTAGIIILAVKLTAVVERWSGFKEKRIKIKPIDSTYCVQAHFNRYKHNLINTFDVSIDH